MLSELAKQGDFLEVETDPKEVFRSHTCFHDCLGLSRVLHTYRPLIVSAG